MTHQTDHNPSEKLTDLLTKGGWSAIPDMIRIVVNQAMVEERAHYLHADEYLRTHERTGYANSCKPMSIQVLVVGNEPSL